MDVAVVILLNLSTQSYRTMDSVYLSAHLVLTNLLLVFAKVAQSTAALVN